MVEKYSYVSRIFHWAGALLVILLFSLGLWMVDLDYYSSWYQTAPQLHVLTGLVLLVLMVARVTARLAKPAPAPLAHLARAEVAAAHLTHLSLYFIIFTVMASGYLIVSSGEGMTIFGWFDLPMIVKLFEQQEDIAGNIHYWSAWSVIVIASIHALAALKHHFISGDDTLRRML